MNTFLEMNRAEAERVEAWRAKESPTPLRSYAGEQGPPFRYPTPELIAYDRGFNRGWWVAAGFYSVMSVLLIAAFHWLGG